MQLLYRYRARSLAKLEYWCNPMHK